MRTADCHVRGCQNDSRRRSAKRFKYNLMYSNSSDRSEHSSISASFDMQHNDDIDIDIREQVDEIENERKDNNDGNENNDNGFIIGETSSQPPALVALPPPINTTDNDSYDYNYTWGSEATFNSTPTLTEHIHYQFHHDQQIHPHQQQQIHIPSPEPDLLTLVQSYDWPQALHRLHHHPSEAISVGVQGRTPLHIACDHDAPAIVIRALLAADELSSSIFNNNNNNDNGTDESNTHHNKDTDKNNTNHSATAITMVGTSNMNPLHIACTSPNASACVVSELLFRSRPDLIPPLQRIAIVKQVTEMKDVDGDTPLHAACRCGAPIEVLALMLEANPSVVWERDYEDLTPLLRLWVRYFVTLGEGVISGVRGEEDLVDDLGEAWEKTVLLLRASYFGSIEVDAVVGMGATTQSGGCHGYDYDETMEANAIVGNFHRCRLCDQSDNVPSLLSFTPPPKPAATIIQSTQEENESHDDKNYEATKLHPTLAISTTSATTIEQEEEQQQQQQQQQPFLLIHAAAKVDCPRPVVKIATKLYPDQLHKTDCDGYTPLALAARAPIFMEHDLSDEGYCIEDRIHGDDVPSFGDGSSDDEHQQRTTTARQRRREEGYKHCSHPSVIQILLDASMEVASYPHPRTGRIPLHYAILSGKNWFEGVHTILEACPNGIMAVDRVTGLYPFMLAATVGSTSEEGKKLRATESLTAVDDGGIVEQADITTIFCLLRRKPESVIWAKTSNSKL